MRTIAFSLRRARPVQAVCVNRATTHSLAAVRARRWFRRPGGNLFRVPPGAGGGETKPAKNNGEAETGRLSERPVRDHKKAG
ncbi:MAG: hypothetical protein ABI795_00535, partial [Chthoniobacterales bacterium]